MENWSVNLETEEYVNDRSLLVKDAIQAIRETTPGCYVNLACAEQHGHPDAYLIPALEEEFADRIDIRFVDQCGCGGYVYKVTRRV